MIDFDSLQIKDEIYVVDRQINVVSRKRFTMVDENGVEWHRYDKSKISYSIAKAQLLGKASRVISGQFPEEYMEFLDVCRWYFKGEDGKEYSVFDYETAVEEQLAMFPKYFYTEQEAEQFVKAREQDNGD